MLIFKYTVIIDKRHNIYLMCMASNILTNIYKLCFGYLVESQWDIIVRVFAILCTYYFWMDRMFDQSLTQFPIF